jgi:hypothetical protein
VRARRAVPPWARRVGAKLLPPPPVLRQGVHPDPADPAVPPLDPQSWPKARQKAFASAEMELFRACLRLPGAPDVRAAALDDLSSYSGLPPEECVERCRNWESWSVEEWLAADRSGTDQFTNFYRTMESWAFDLLWYAYMQTEGYGYPASVMALRAIAAKGNGRAHLDFGSGAGVTSQLFARAGYETTLADISTSLLDFARHRLIRRGEAARFVALNDEKLETSSPRSTRSFTFLILRTLWPASTARSGRGGGWSPTSMYVPRRWRMPCTSTKMTSIFARSYTVRASRRPAASGSTWCTAGWTLQAQLSGSGYYSSSSSSPAAPAVSSAARTGAWRPRSGRRPGSCYRQGAATGLAVTSLGRRAAGGSHP